MFHIGGVEWINLGLSGGQNRKIFDLRSLFDLFYALALNITLRHTNYIQKYVVFKYHLRDFLTVWHLHYHIYIHEILEWKTPFFAKSNNNNHNNKTKRSDNMKMRLTGFKASKCIYAYGHAS